MTNTGVRPLHRILGLGFGLALAFGSAVGFPLSTAVVLLGSVLFLAAAVAEDHRSGIIAGALLIASIPAYEFIVRRRAIAQAGILTPES